MNFIDLDDEMTIQTSEETNVNTISGIANLIEDSGRSNIMLPERT